MTVAARPGWVDDALFPFESRFLDVGGNILHYVDEGSGPVLFFLHGNPTWSFVYRNVIAALWDSFRCIAVDLPGFGLSSAAPGHRHLPEEDARIITAFVDALSIQDATLVVHDWGGPIGLYAAAQRPAAFSRGEHHGAVGNGEQHRVVVVLV
jgi:haloalkane dehalogenase